MTSNSIGDSGLAALCDGAALSSSLRRIQLWGNSFASASTDAFVALHREAYVFCCLLTLISLYGRHLCGANHALVGHACHCSSSSSGVEVDVEPYLVDGKVQLAHLALADD